MKQLAQNLWVMPYSLPVFGSRFPTRSDGRSPALGELVIHSTGPFTPKDVAAVPGIWANPAGYWTPFCGTIPSPGRGAKLFRTFPSWRRSYSDVVGFPTVPLIPAPSAWSEELEVLRLEGIPRIREHVVYHRPSRTLIVADLLLDFGHDISGWKRFLVFCAIGLEAPSWYVAAVPNGGQGQGGLSSAPWRP